MTGLTDSTTGLKFGDALVWLQGGLGTPNLTDPDILPSTPMQAEDSSDMISETGDTMITEA